MPASIAAHLLLTANHLHPAITGSRASQHHRQGIRERPGFTNAVPAIMTAASHYSQCVAIYTVTTHQYVAKHVTTHQCVAKHGYYSPVCD